MITKKEIDFSAYSQTVEFIKPDFLSRMIVGVFRLFKPNTAAYKLEFYERMLNFLRMTGLAALAGNRSALPVNRQLSDNMDNNKASPSFIEFLYHFNILVLRNNRLTINECYERLTEDGIIKKVINGEDHTLPGSLSKKERRTVRDFLFVNDLVKKYGDPEYTFQTIKKNKRFWESLIIGKKLDYEVRLCETLYNLADLKIPQKIKSPFDDDYYTESGQNAFKNFTKFVFLDYLKKIYPGNNTISVFDLGCGYGNYIEAIHNAFPGSEITGIEINPVVYTATKKKFEGDGNIAIVNENFFDYAATKKYDLIIMNYVLFYFNAAEKKKVIEKTKDMLTSNGSIVICQYFSGIEDLKIRLAKMQNDYTLSKKIEIYYSEKILYANTLWNDSVDTFSEAVKWDELKILIAGSGLHIESMTNADKFYYSLFIEFKKN